MISSYCLDYNTWVFIPRHVKEDFAEMREMGVDTVCLSFSENDMAYARRTFEQLVDLAHEEGLIARIEADKVQHPTEPCGSGA